MSVKRMAVAALLFAMSASAFAAETGMLALTSTSTLGIVYAASPEARVRNGSS